MELTIRSCLLIVPLSILFPELVEERRLVLPVRLHGTRKSNSKFLTQNAGILKPEEPAELKLVSGTRV